MFKVLGAFWYFFSIQREIDCWGYACRIENGCEFSTSCVENTFRNITLIKNLCPINPPDATIFDFGIFLYALQSGMQASINKLSRKVLAMFFMGPTKFEVYLYKTLVLANIFSYIMITII